MMAAFSPLTMKEFRAIPSGMGHMPSKRMFSTLAERRYMPSVTCVVFISITILKDYNNTSLTVFNVLAKGQQLQGVKNEGGE
jgi:hypothetical protein